MAGERAFLNGDLAHGARRLRARPSGLAAPIVLVLAFGESLAFISLLIPAWGALVAIGALIGPAASVSGRSGLRRDRGGAR